MSFFKIDEYSRRVREDFDKGQLFEQLIKKYLLDNPFKLNLISSPNEQKASRDDRVERKKLEALTLALTDQEKESIV